MMTTPENLRDYLENNFKMAKCFFYGDGSLTLLNDEDFQLKHIEEVQQHGGEGEGDQYWRVWKFVLSNDQEFYLKFYGYYASYSGADYHNCCIVKPVQVTRTEYV